MKIQNHPLLIGALALLFSTASQAQQIKVDFTGTITDLGVLLTGNGVSVGDSMSGSFTYDSNTGALSAFSHSFGNGFVASMSGSAHLFVQNDQQNGFATLPADGFTATASSTSNTDWNGLSNPDMQFGVLQDNVVGQLWNDTLPPDLSDWALITLFTVNNPDWRWLDFNAQNTNSFSDDQIRYLVTQYSVSQVPVPGAMWLFASGIMGLIGFKRRKTV